MVALACLCSLFAMNFACTNWENTTYQTLSSAKATIDCASAGYNRNDAQITQYCVGVMTPSTMYLPQTTAVHDVLAKAGTAKDAAVNAMIAYEASKGAAGSTNQTTLQTSVNTAVAALSADVVAVAALIKTGGK